jgi:hypothetical protein
LVIYDRYQRDRGKILSPVTDVIDTSEKFITGIVVTGDHCSLVLLILAINLSPVPLSPAIIVQR